MLPSSLQRNIAGRNWLSHRFETSGVVERGSRRSAPRAAAAAETGGCDEGRASYMCVKSNAGEAEFLTGNAALSWATWTPDFISMTHQSIWYAFSWNFAHSTMYSFLPIRSACICHRFLFGQIPDRCWCYFGSQVQETSETRENSLLLVWLWPVLFTQPILSARRGGVRLDQRFTSQCAVCGRLNFDRHTR